MNQKKDLFDLIRDNAHKLDECPSKSSWERLEKRLDDRPFKSRFSIRKILYIAAGIAMVLVCIPIISQVVQSESSPMAMNEADFASSEFVVEELEVSQNGEQGFYKVVEFQRKHQDRLSNPVPEGSRKKLAVATAHRGNLGGINTMAFAGNTRLDAKLNEMNGKLKTDSNLDYDYSPSKISTPITDVQSAPTLPEVQQFQWLLGSWQGEMTSNNKDKNKVIFEQWIQTDPRTIEGTGYLMVDGKSTFAEGMKIQQMGNQVIFSADTDGSGTLSKYNLTSNDYQQAIFENKVVPFPQKVIIQKNGSKKFTTILCNDSFAKPDKKQLLYLKNRNSELQSNKITRQLRKVE